MNSLSWACIPVVACSLSGYLYGIAIVQLSMPRQPKSSIKGTVLRRQLNDPSSRCQFVSTQFLASH
jgi:hypothetical protein